VKRRTDISPADLAGVAAAGNRCTAALNWAVLYDSVAPLPRAGEALGSRTPEESVITDRRVDRTDGDR
jgi:hypothetical protein